MKKQLLGFTLFETIISVAILGIVVTAVLSLNINARQISTSVITQSSLQEELRTAAALIADEVQRAYYVFPPCGAYTATKAITYSCGTRFSTTNYDTTALNVNYSRFTLGTTAYTTIRPDKVSANSDARTWTVSGAANNDAPILAMIVAPRDSTQSCTSTNETIFSRACYYFVAYYPVKRSTVTRASGDTASLSKEKLEPLADNEDQWVLMEYREALTGSSDDIFAETGVSVPGIAGSIDVPSVPWGEVGCTPSVTCQPANATRYTNRAPLADPSPLIQNVNGNLPAVYRGVTDPLARARFTAKMSSTVALIGSGNIGANIVATNINPRGFQIAFPVGSIDERGVTEVQIKLQGGIRQGNTTATFPNQPIEVFASPRNITPAYLGR